MKSAGSCSENIAMKFVVILEGRGRWIWELRTADGQVVCRSIMSFGDRGQAFKAIQAVRGMARRARVYDPLGTLDNGP